MKRLKKEEENTLIRRIKSWDVYQRVPRELTEPSMTGATSKLEHVNPLVTLMCMTILMMLLITQVGKFLTYTLKSELVMIQPDNSTSQQINMSLQIWFHKVPCDLLTLETKDVMGNEVRDLFEQEGNMLVRHVLDQDGDVVEEFQRSSQYNYNVMDIQEQVEQGFGCRIKGKITIPKVPGTIIISPHGQKGSQEAALQIISKGYNLDFTHLIRTLEFEPDIDSSFADPEFRALRILKQMSPHLSGMTTLHPHSNSHPLPGLYAAYYLDVTPMKYIKIDQEIMRIYHYQAHHSTLLQQGLSQIIIKYEISPIGIVNMLTKMTFYEFLIELCAVIGGFITVCNILDRLLSSISDSLGLTVESDEQTPGQTRK